MQLSYRKYLVWALAFVISASALSAGTVRAQEEQDARIQEIVSSMTTEQKLTQMMVVALRTTDPEGGPVTELTTPYQETLEKYDFGGVILFASNIVDTKQTITLIRDCQEAALRSDVALPMLICVDQEGGIVNRVAFGTTGPGSMALAAAGDPAQAEECANLLGQEIAALGFNMNFAPVCDVNSNPNNPVIGTRSFSDDPAIVAEYVRVYMEGLQKNNIASALKHFPGHGNVGEDSHTGLPKSELSLEELRECELIPFQAGIEAGADMIMTAHIQYPSIEKNTYISKEDGAAVFLPATLSRAILTDLLRDEMGYEGIIITDAMDMGAITTHFDPLDAASMAINAGVDILLCPLNLYQDENIDSLPWTEEFIAGLVARVEGGEISEARLNESVARILQMKQDKGILDADYGQPLEELAAAASETVGAPEHLDSQWTMAENAMTLLKNDSGMLPLDGLDGRKTLILYPSEYRQPTVEYAIARLEKEGLLEAESVSALCYADLPGEELMAAAADADRVLVLSQSAAKNADLWELIGQLHQKDVGTALLSLNLPYDAACYENADAVLCAYQPYGNAHDSDGNGPFNLNVAVALCTAFGRNVPHGCLPVNVPKLAETEDGSEFSEELLYKRGFGLQDWGRTAGDIEDETAAEDA